MSGLARLTTRLCASPTRQENCQKGGCRGASRLSDRTTARTFLPTYRNMTGSAVFPPTSDIIPSSAHSSTAMLPSATDPSRESGRPLRLLYAISSAVSMNWGLTTCNCSTQSHCRNSLYFCLCRRNETRENPHSSISSKHCLKPM